MFVSQEEWGAIDETLDVLQDEQMLDYRILYTLERRGVIVRAPAPGFCVRRARPMHGIEFE